MTDNNNKFPDKFNELIKIIKKDKDNEVEFRYTEIIHPNPVSIYMKYDLNSYNVNHVILIIKITMDYEHDGERFEVIRTFPNGNISQITDEYKSKIYPQDELYPGEVGITLYTTLNKGQYLVLRYDDYDLQEQCKVTEINKELTDYLDDASMYNDESRGLTRHGDDAFYSCIIDSDGNIFWKDNKNEDWVNDIEYNEYDEPIFKECLPKPDFVKWEKVKKFVTYRYSGPIFQCDQKID